MAHCRQSNIQSYIYLVGMFKAIWTFSERLVLWLADPVGICLWFVHLLFLVISFLFFPLAFAAFFLFNFSFFRNSLSDIKLSSNKLTPPSLGTSFWSDDANTDPGPREPPWEEIGPLTGRSVDGPTLLVVWMIIIVIQFCPTSIPTYKDHYQNKLQHTLSVLDVKVQSMLMFSFWMKELLLINNRTGVRGGFFSY